VLTESADALADDDGLLSEARAKFRSGELNAYAGENEWLAEQQQRHLEAAERARDRAYQDVAELLHGPRYESWPTPDGRKARRDNHEVAFRLLAFIEHPDYPYVPEDWTPDDPPTKPGSHDPESVIESLRGLIHDRVRSRRSTPPRTIRDVLDAEPRSRRCLAGGRRSMGDRQKGEVKNVIRHCKRLSCPNCGPAQVERILTGATTVWNGEPIYRHEFGPQEWRGSWRGRMLGIARPSEFLRVPHDDGSCTVFVPNYADGGELISADALPSALLDAIGRAPVVGRRITLPSRTTNEHEEKPEEKPADDGNRFVLVLPMDVSMRHINQVTRQAIGRDVPTYTDISGDRYGIAYVFRGLTPEEVDAVREALEPYVVRARTQAAELTRIGRALDLMFETHNGPGTVKELARRMGKSESWVRLGVKQALHEGTVVMAGKIGRAVVYQNSQDRSASVAYLPSMSTPSNPTVRID
jgi:hypothetical protein